MSKTISYELLDEQMKKKLGDLIDAGQSITPAMQNVGRKLKTKVQLGFKSGASPWGAKWAPLSALTRHGGQPLRNTGHLMNSITAQVKNNSVEIGTNLQAEGGVKFPAVHQFGAVIKPVNAKRLRWMHPGGFPVFAKKVVIPARPFLPLTASGATDLPEKWAADVLSSLRLHFEKAANK